FFRAGGRNRVDKAHERRRHDGGPEICHRQPPSQVIGQRAVHMQKSDGLPCGNAVIGSGGA
ncbi:MAG: hypothetical protein ABSG43_15260, partial [Solirubrobacteraceae bacterium]